MILIQHLLGLATAAMLYVCARRITGSRWIPALPAAVVALSGDQILLEHSVLTESLYTFLVTAALCAVALADASKRGYGLLLAGGFLLGSAATVRTVAISLIAVPVLWLWSGSAPGSTAAPRSRRICGSGGRRAALLPRRSGRVHRLLGRLRLRAGLSTRGSRRSRTVAEFTPPSGTTFLCERTRSRGACRARTPRTGLLPVRRRSGDREVRKSIPDRARGNKTVRRFAVAALLGQPLDYLREVSRESLHYVVPSAGYDRPYSFASAEELDIARRETTIEAATIERAESVGFDADPVDVEDSSTHVLQDLQHALRVQGLSLVLLLALGLLGVGLGQGMVRSASGLFLVFALAQALVPVATLGWEFPLRRAGDRPVGGRGGPRHPRARPTGPRLTLNCHAQEARTSPAG